MTMSGNPAWVTVGVRHAQDEVVRFLFDPYVVQPDICELSP